MTVNDLVFHAFVLLTAAAGITLSLSKNVIHAAFLLFGVLLGVAALYVFAGAEFLAVSQVIVYVGGALIVVIFGVMLTAKMREMKPQTELVNLVPGTMLSISLFLMLLYVMRESGVTRSIQPQVPAGVANVEAVGFATLTDYLLPFELVSVLLLTVLVGAAYLSRKSKTEKEAGS